MNETQTISAPPPAPRAQEALKPRSRVIPYPAIEQHGVIGDRRTAALVAADGTLDWMCLPDFDGDIVFGALLDRSKGGHWRLGPARMTSGKQTYLEDSVVLETRWELPEGALLLQDVMLWPEKDRPPEQANVRVIVRALRCLRGKIRCELELLPGRDFHKSPASLTRHSTGFTIELGPHSLNPLSLRFWTNRPPEMVDHRLHGIFDLSEGEELWAVLESGAAGHGWSAQEARAALEKTRQYWQNWLSGLPLLGQGDREIRHTALAVHLLTYAPQGSVVAAPTASLPERIGGSLNVDYRLCWVRDTSLAVGMLARLGKLQEAEQSLQWLMGRISRFGQPLQILYGIRGETRPRQQTLAGAAGYRESAPVRIGNHAYKQHQLGSLGYLADCIWIYLNHDGNWRQEYWDFIHRLAKYTLKHWQDPENGPWGLPERRHYVSSKILSWVMLDRAIKISQKVNPSFDTSSWHSTCGAIHAEVMDKGWSERLRSFRQHYDGENLDAASLLVSVLDFLPGDHPRVLSTIERISEFLAIDNFTFRFDPTETPGLGELPLGEFEGAFFPSTFWLATAYAKAGQPDRAAQILEQAEQIAGPLGLFPEAVDPRTGSFRGNTPLLFSHVEYIRAKLEIAHARK